MKIINMKVVCIHTKAFVDYFQMSTHVPEFQTFFSVFYYLVLTNLATSSIRVKIFSEKLSDRIKRYDQTSQGVSAAPSANGLKLRRT